MNFSKIFLGTALGLAATGAFAQQTSTGFFNDGYLYRHEMNPAIANSDSYVAFPGMGNLNVGYRGNVSLGDFIYSRGGKTVLFMNDQVTPQEFLKNINDKNKLNAEVKVNVLSVGFKTKNSYQTIGVNLRSNIGVVLPGELLRMAKEGPSNNVYDLSATNVHADAFLEMAYGYSRDINEQWRVGGKVKFLLGGGNIDAKFKDARFELHEDKWVATTDAEIQASVKDLTFDKDTKLRGPEGSETEHEYVSGMDIDKAGLNGWGLAFDLGATYQLDEDWKFGLSLLDLGFINWNNNMLASTDGRQTVSTDDYVFNPDDAASNSFDNEWDRFTEGLSALYELQDKGDQGKRTKALAATINASAEYSCPFYRPLTLGLMNTTKIQGKYSWTEFRLSANYAPCKIFSASMSLAEGTYGASFGWMLNLHPKGFNMFVGMDHTFAKMAKPCVPMAGKFNVNFGINFPF